MDDILKGNFTVKRPITLDKEKEEEKESLSKKLKKRVLGSLGGSMVYIERSRLTWEEDE